MSNLFTEVLIVGGGPAGLACALSIARGGGNVILCDDNNARNKNSKSIRNIPGHEGLSPAEYRKLLKDSLKKYDNVSLLDDAVRSIDKVKDGFIAILEDQRIIQSKRIVLAEGLRDILPQITGLNELWGLSVFHCPYCHGYESIGKEFGVIATNEKVIALIRILTGINDDISIFTNGEDIFTKEQILKFKEANLKVYTHKICKIIAPDLRLKSLKLNNNEEIKIKTLFIQNKVLPKTDLGQTLGCKITEEGIYKVNENGESTVKGVYCAGDVGSKNHSVIMATALGSHVGICVNADLARKIFKE